MVPQPLQRRLVDARLAPTPERLEALLRELVRRGGAPCEPGAARRWLTLDDLPELGVLVTILDVARCRDVVVRLRRAGDRVVLWLASGLELVLESQAEGWRAVRFLDEVGDVLWDAAQPAGRLRADLDTLTGVLARLSVWRGLAMQSVTGELRPQPTAEVVEALSGTGTDVGRGLLRALRRGCLSALPIEPPDVCVELSGQLLDAMLDLVAGRVEIVSRTGEDYGAELSLDDGRRLVGSIGYDGAIDEIYGLRTEAGEEFYPPVDVELAPFEWAVMRVAWALSCACAWPEMADEAPVDETVESSDPPSSAETSTVEVPTPSASFGPDALTAMRQRLVREHAGHMGSAPRQETHPLLVVVWMFVVMLTLLLLIGPGGGGGGGRFGAGMPPAVQVEMPRIELPVYDAGELAGMRIELARLGSMVDAQGRIVWFRAPIEGLLDGAVAGGALGRPLRL